MVVKLTHSAVKNEKSDDREESSSETEMTAKRGNDRVLAIEAIESRIQEFVYEPEEERTFELWWSRHSDIFEVDLASWDDVRKVRLLLRHVHAKVQRMFEDSILPKKPSELSLEDAVKALTKLFGDTRTLFEKRKSMMSLKMSKEGIDDVRAFATRVNRTVQSAQVTEMTSEQMKCLIFLQGIDLPRYGDVHLLMLKEAKLKKDCTLESLLDVYNNSIELRRESRGVTDERHQVNAVQYESREPKVLADPKTRQRLAHRREACYRCGNTKHGADDCFYRTQNCHACGEKGHIEKMLLNRS